MLAMSFQNTHFCELSLAFSSSYMLFALLRACWEASIEVLKIFISCYWVYSDHPNQSIFDKTHWDSAWGKPVTSVRYWFNCKIIHFFKNSNLLLRFFLLSPEPWNDRRYNFLLGIWRTLSHLLSVFSSQGYPRSNLSISFWRTSFEGLGFFVILGTILGICSIFSKTLKIMSRLEY